MGRPLLASLALALGTLVVCLALGQQAFYGADAQGFVVAMTRPGVRLPNHPLYLPILRGFHALLGPFGCSHFVAARAASACGTAVAVGFAHAAAVLVLARPRQALLATLWIAATPAVLFFATVVEIHGVFVAPAAVAWWLAARAARDGRISTAVALGAVTGVAALVHATGHLLPVLVGTWLAWPVRAPAGALVARLACVFAAHALVSGGGALLLREAGTGTALANQSGFLLEYLRQVPPLAGFPRQLWREWLAPFALVSVLAWAGLARGRRAATLALAASVLLYGAAAYVLVGTDGDERGAYLLPLAWPAVWLAVEALPGRVAWLALAASAAIAVARVAEHDHARGDAHWYAGLAQATASQRPLLIHGTLEELEWVLRERADTPAVGLLDFVRAPADQAPLWCAQLARLLDESLASGLTPYVCPSARQLLERTATMPASAAVGRMLAEHYRAESVEHGAFRAERLSAR